MKVKICGVCRPEDAAAAAFAGADYVGVILGAKSPRLRTVEEAAGVYAAAPGVARVGVFADVAVSEVVAVARRLKLDVVQLHGGESPADVRELRRVGPWAVWKAVRPRDGSELTSAIAAYGGAVDGLLVDGWSADAGGGTGVRAPWAALAPLRCRIPGDVAFVAAGGLRPENVADAIAALSPDVVDVSSGVEARVGEKSAERVRAFVEAARTACLEGNRTEA